MQRDRGPQAITNYQLPTQVNKKCASGYRAFEIYAIGNQFLRKLQFRLLMFYIDFLWESMGIFDWLFGEENI